MTTDRIFATALGAFGAASAIPLALAQLDFAGLFNAYNIDAGDTPAVLRTLAGVAGILTFGVIATGLVGAALALTEARGARTVLVVAATAGFVTAFPFWVPNAVALAVAAWLLGREEKGAPVIGATPTASTG
jgi:hypothetical protein